MASLSFFLCKSRALSESVFAELVVYAGSNFEDRCANILLVEADLWRGFLVLLPLLQSTCFWRGAEVALVKQSPASAMVGNIYRGDCCVWGP